MHPKGPVIIYGRGGGKNKGGHMYKYITRRGGY